MYTYQSASTMPLTFASVSESEIGYIASKGLLYWQLTQTLLQIKSMEVMQIYTPAQRRVSRPAGLGWISGPPAIAHVAFCWGVFQFYIYLYILVIENTTSCICELVSEAKLGHLENDGFLYWHSYRLHDVYIIIFIQNGAQTSHGRRGLYIKVSELELVYIQKKSSLLILVLRPRKAGSETSTRRKWWTLFIGLIY